MAITLTACGTPAAGTGSPRQPTPAATAATRRLDAIGDPGDDSRPVRARWQYRPRRPPSLEQWINQRIAPRDGSRSWWSSAPEDALIRDLLAGKGDIAANLLLTFERDEQVAFATPIVTGIRELMVTGANEQPLVSLEDVGGRADPRPQGERSPRQPDAPQRTAHQDRRGRRRGSSSRRHTKTDEDLIKRVNAGQIPATVAYDYDFRACCAALPGLHVNADVAVSQDGSLSWVTRKDTPQLLAILDAFFSLNRDDCVNGLLS